MDNSYKDESFDDDLEWILQKLTERTGATSGIILRFNAAGERCELLAGHGTSSELSAAELAVVCDTVRLAPAWHGVQSFPIDLLAAGGKRFRLLALRFMPAPGMVVVAAVCRPESSFNLLQSYVAARLEPVLARYIRLWWLHRSERRRANAFERAIDHCDLGVMLLDGKGRPSYVNPAAHQILRKGDALRWRGDAIATADSSQTLKFVQALQRAGEQKRAIATLLTLPRNERRSLIVSVVGLDPPALEAGDAAVILYLLDPEQDVSLLLAPACHIYHLTATEARLVARLVSGADLADAAASLNLAVQTARSYLKQIFLKTGTNRQAELVRIMCGSVARATLGGEFSRCVSRV